MKKRLFLSLLIILIATSGFIVSRKILTDNSTEQTTFFSFENEIKTGDIIFQTSLSGQSKAIELATKSSYTHCGIIYKKDSHFFVFEAIQPVSLTPIEKWIAKGENSHYVIKRLKNSEEVINTNSINKMIAEAEKLKGKNYDVYFEWTDEKIYCSELVWKIYKRALNIEIGKLEHLKDFDLSSEQVKSKMKERYGKNIPLDELVISPGNIFNSNLLITVEEN